MLKNAESNAEYKGLDADHLVIDHIQVRSLFCLVYLAEFEDCFISGFSSYSYFSDPRHSSSDSYVVHLVIDHIQGGDSS